ncbi:metalloendopeptidase [Trichonephila clavipes]|nr:metalloendopeptidase [Trichonephila clavipes]
MKVLVFLGIIAAVSAVPTHHDPMINEGLFEGDILGIDPNADRNAIPRDSQRWPGGVVPYIILPELNNLKSKIQTAMKHIEDNSCIRFVPRTNQQDYVKIFKHNGSVMTFFFQVLSHFLTYLVK